MKMLNKGLTWIMTLMMALSLATFSSCIESNDDCPAVEEEKPVYISFTIITYSAKQSRAEDDNCYDDLIGTAPEDYLNVHDIRFLIFDFDGNFISDVTPKCEVSLRDNSVSPIYQVSARLDEPYFVEKVNDPDYNETLKFYILAVGNYSDWGVTFPPLQEGLTMEELFNNGVVMTNKPNAVNMLIANSDSPDAMRFPMVGLQGYSITKNAMLGGTVNSPVNISSGTRGGTLSMLRAVAKIEVIDKINIGENEVFTNEDTADPLRIDKVELNGFNNAGSMLPAFDQWPQIVTGTQSIACHQTAQVDSPTVPATVEYMVPPVLNEDNSFGPSQGLSDYIMDLAYDQLATARRDDQCPVYSCYVFEYSRALLSAGTQQPYVRITTKGSQSLEQPMESLVLPMRLADYEVNPPVNLPFLLRNHIYRYEIVGINQDISVNWTVCPMDNVPANIEFN
ncbi:MAG: hypothetical protein K2G40_05465 [Muribaculaceae bacterium]|nr:hypothetical protein [Muribaculaceae bacterium]